VSVAAFLAELRSRNMEIWADGEQLRCTAPAGALTAELREHLRLHKYDILAFLRSAETLARQPRGIVPLQAGGARPPIFAVPGHSGDVFCYRALVEHLDRDQPFFGLQPPGVDGRDEPLTRIEDVAAYFGDQILAFHGAGPMVIAGYCAGGTIAFELARQLTERGATVSCVALFAGPYPTWYRALPQLEERARYVANQARHHLRELRARSLAEGRRYVQEHFRFRAARRKEALVAAANPLLTPRHKVEAVTLAAVRAYLPRYFPGRLCLFVPNRRWLRSRALSKRWRRVARDVEEYCGPGCEGDAQLLEPAAQVLARQICGLHATGPVQQCGTPATPAGRI
jgi:thioesterase domain-containing protein